MRIQCKAEEINHPLTYLIYPVLTNRHAMETNIPIKEEKTFFETVLNTVRESVTVTDRDLRITYQNKASRYAFGPRIGEFCFKAYRARTEPCENCMVIEVLKDGRPRRGIRDVRLSNGDIAWVEYTSAPLRDQEGKIIGAVEAGHDVTERLRLFEECGTLRREMERKARFDNIITQSKQMKAIFRVIERVASTSSTVLITGESGTGKELIAGSIHFNSDRKEKPFVSINCGAIPENLLESELFGHIRGAFTGAIRDNKGLVESSDGGTLFLDEVDEMPLSLQVKLLRFLQEGESRRIGDTKIRKFDVRIISATNRNLEKAVKDGIFREDLFFRLNVIPLLLPPLRERREDIPLLATHLFQRLCDEHGRKVSGISSRALKLLMDYSWPGNVRELENTIEYALHLSDDGSPISADQLPPMISGNTRVQVDHMNPISIEAYTRQTILALQADHTEKEIAEILGISRKNLWEKRKRWALPRPA